MPFHRVIKSFLGAFLFLTGLSTYSASAQQPEPWQLGFQPAATPIMEQIHIFNNITLWIITIVTVFVLLLLLVVIVKFNKRANPVASKTSHNTLVEVVWTVAPIIILMIIMVPSLRLLYAQQVIPDADVTIKVTGYQWNWGYEYPDHEIGEYVSSMLPVGDDGKDLSAHKEAALVRGDTLDNYPRLMAVDNELVVPVGKIVRLDVTSGDVIHAVAVPSFGIKVDAIPGRLNSTWFKAEKEGIYYGQCSQICGAGEGYAGHSFMPLAVRVVDEATFEAWAKAAKDDVEESYKIFANSHIGSSIKLAQRQN